MISSQWLRRDVSIGEMMPASRHFGTLYEHGNTTSGLKPARILAKASSSSPQSEKLGASPYFASYSAWNPSSS